MARYEVIQFICKHTEEVLLLGSLKEIERRKAGMAAHWLCSDCYRDHKRYERQIALEEQMKVVAALGLADITGGSVKQNAWAARIRAQALGRAAYYGNDTECLIKSFRSRVASMVAELRPFDITVDKGRVDGFNAAFEMNIKSVRAKLEANVSAEWWIRNQYRVDNYVYNARTDAEPAEYKSLCGTLATLKAKAKADADAQKEAEWKAEWTAQRERERKCQEEATRYTLTLAQLKIVSVERDRDWFEIVAADGRTGTGFIDHEWVLSNFDGIQVDCDHEIAMRISADAQRLNERSLT